MTPHESATNPVLARVIPLHETLGIAAELAGEGRSRMRLTVETRHLRTHGLLHGGVTAALLDTALGHAVMSLAPPDHHAVTAQININYIKPAYEGVELLATGFVIHAGTKTAVATGEVRTGEGTLIATATGTFLFLLLA